jgi:N-methylhydantoinase A
MTYSICIDIGGTFTDCVVSSEAEGTHIFKCPSTPGAFEKGFMDVLALAAEHYGISLDDFLGRTERIVHGTTVTTNALVEGKVASVGLICNEGHPDVLTYREAPRKRAWEWKLDYPDPYVPRNRTYEVHGRVDSQGNEIDALSEQDVRDAIAFFRRAEVEAIAVALLWSIANPAHELKVGEIIAREWPEIPVALSHQVNPIPREYRRTVSTAINVSLYPVFSSYVKELARVLREAGYERDLLVANCVGGMMPAEEIVKRPIYSVMSGPTLAPIAAQSLTTHSDVVVVDMGGTTFDVSAIRGRELVISPEAMILPFDMLGLPKVDVRSIGAGGGSIAWVDVGGLLRVGPQSAGATPGPACYGQGGTLPTVTDADVVLGIIDPDYFLGGRMALDPAAAEAAVGTIADTLGLSLVDAAYAIHTTCNHSMITAIEDVTVKEGINPRDSYLVGGGGATACHIAEMARVLGIGLFMVPKFAAALSAYGGLISDIRWEAVGSLHTSSASFQTDAVNNLLRDLRGQCLAFLTQAGVAPADRSFRHTFQGRYQYQSWEIEVPFEVGDQGLSDADLTGLCEAFHQMHERIYSIKDPGDTVEFVTWKVTAIGSSPILAGGLPAAASRGPGDAGVKAHRPVYIRDRGGLVEVPIFDGGAMGEGASVAGPAVIEEETTTLLLLPGMTARTDAQGNYLVEG